MKMKTLMAAILVFASLTAFASCGEEKPEELAYISGTVYEKQTRALLTDITVSIGGQSMTTTADGRFIFSKLEKGSSHTLEAFGQQYKDFKLDNVVAIYPGTNQDIELEIEIPNPPKTSSISNTTTKTLKSFDYVINFGTAPTQISYELTGSFSSPNRFSHSMKQFREQQIQVGPDDAKKESPPIKLIEIDGKQWIDEGNGFSAVEPDRLRLGFRELYSLIEDRSGLLGNALKQIKNLEDLGPATIAGVTCNRYSGLVVMDSVRYVDSAQGRKTVKDVILCDFTVALSTQKETENAPVDLEMMVYYKDLQSRTYTKFTLNNINNPIVIEPPEIKGPDSKIKINR